jgi:hypothetical protein
VRRPRDPGVETETRCTHVVRARQRQLRVRDGGCRPGDVRRSPYGQRLALLRCGRRDCSSKAAVRLRAAAGRPPLHAVRAHRELIIGS